MSKSIDIAKLFEAESSAAHIPAGFEPIPTKALAVIDNIKVVDKKSYKYAKCVITFKSGNTKQADLYGFKRGEEPPVGTAIDKATALFRLSDDGEYWHIYARKTSRK